MVYGYLTERVKRIIEEKRFSERRKPTKKMTKKVQNGAAKTFSGLTTKNETVFETSDTK